MELFSPQNLHFKVDSSTSLVPSRLTAQTGMSRAAFHTKSTAFALQCFGKWLGAGLEPGSMTACCPRTVGGQSLAAAGQATGTEAEPRAGMPGTHQEQRPQLPWCRSVTRETHVKGKCLLTGKGLLSFIFVFQNKCDKFIKFFWEKFKFSLFLRSKLHKVNGFNKQTSRKNEEQSPISTKVSYIENAPKYLKLLYRCILPGYQNSSLTESKYFYYQPELKQTNQMPTK